VLTTPITTGAEGCDRLRWVGLNAIPLSCGAESRVGVGRFLRRARLREPIYLVSSSIHARPERLVSQAEPAESALLA
jgi:hypothetical protein